MRPEMGAPILVTNFKTVIVDSGIPSPASAKRVSLLQKRCCFMNWRKCNEKDSNSECSYVCGIFVEVFFR